MVLHLPLHASRVCGSGCRSVCVHVLVCLNVCVCVCVCLSLRARVCVCVYVHMCVLVDYHLFLHSRADTFSEGMEMGKLINDN